MYFSINFFLFIYFSSIFSTIDGTNSQNQAIFSEVIREALILAKNDHLSPELGKRKHVDSSLLADILQGPKKIKHGESSSSTIIKQNVETSIGATGIEIKEFHFVYNKKEYLFKEYAPQTFVQLRTIFGIEPSKYFNSLTNKALKGFMNPGKGGSTFLLSNDEQFFLKSLIRNEHKLMLKNLAAYAEYMSQNLNSFLTKYCGLYSIQKRAFLESWDDEKKFEKNSDEIFWFFTMKHLFKQLNPISPNLVNSRIDYRFDLKGYQSGRRKLSEKELAVNEPTFKEWEFNGLGHDGGPLFPEGIICDEKVYKLIASNLAKDVKFLADQFKVWDYSLFVGIHFNDLNEEKEASEILKSKSNSEYPIIRMSNGGIGGMYCKKCKPPADYNINQGIVGKYSISIFVGIIDLFAKWDLCDCVKMVQKVFLKRKSLEPVTYVTPPKYAARFKCFVNNQIFHVENEEEQKIHRDEYCHDFETIEWCGDKKWTRKDEERIFGGYIDRSGKVAKIVYPNQIKYQKP